MSKTNTTNRTESNGIVDLCLYVCKMAEVVKKDYVPLKRLSFIARLKYINYYQIFKCLHVLPLLITLFPTLNNDEFWVLFKWRFTSFITFNVYLMVITTIITSITTITIFLLNTY